MSADRWPDDLTTELIAVRRHLHRHPELSNAEIRTQLFIRETLARLGLGKISDAAGTGLVVDVHGTRPGANRMVVVRADIDALPITEDTGLPFASETKGVMHACGHDAHTAMVVAAAAALSRRRDTFGGTVRFIFQPAEETEPLGGRRIVAEGWLDGAAAAFGIHVDPDLETGRIAVAPGAYTLASDTFDIRLKGRSAHAAMPHLACDALQAGAAIATALRGLPAATVSAYGEAVLSVTGIEAGGSYNIIPDSCLLRGTYRTGSADIREKLAARLQETVDRLAALFAVTGDVQITRGEPAVVNDPLAVEAVRAAAARIGGIAVEARRGWEPADDFGFYAEKCPAAYVRLGIRPAGTATAYPLHHPKFAVDEAALPLGAALLAEVACEAASRGLALT